MEKIRIEFANKKELLSGANPDEGGWYCHQHETGKYFWYRGYAISEICEDIPGSCRITSNCSITSNLWYLSQNENS